MRDPEMCFELVAAEDGTHSLNPFYYRNDYAGIEQWSRNLIDGLHVGLAVLHSEHVSFATMWDNNIRVQGLGDVFDTRHILA